MCLFLFSCSMDLHSVARNLIRERQLELSSSELPGYIMRYSTEGYSGEISKLAQTWAHQSTRQHVSMKSCGTSAELSR